MKTVRITQDLTTYYEAKKGNTTYILEKQASITSSEMVGLFGATAVEDRNFIIKGDISASQGYGLHVGANDGTGGGVVDIAKSANVWGQTGVNLAADGQILRNAGKIGGEYGINASGDNIRIENTGFISGSVVGLDFSFGSATIRNDGMITGDKNAISTFLTAGDRLKIVNTGTIDSSEYGVMLGNQDGSRTVLVNHGTIDAEFWSIQANFTNSVEIIRNRGDIPSQVWLGDGNDIFDGRGGRAFYVDGGDGDDLYIVDEPLIKLGEQMNAGTDTVKSSITWTLGANIENLVLTGTNSISGTGSDIANRISGNSGQNTLFGLGGTDIINGGRGNDILHGGAAADTFVFATGTGHDTIADFQDGIDLIDITGIRKINDFAQIADAMTQNGTDVVIDLGGKDSLTIQNVTIDKLTAIDFAY
ncbi:MAG: M10 family metallopeptidase C-terminal domain-containing protein [Rhizobium sp.]|nr:M10 family metallopeptidase C-terminal domain-containing protein [Rhizobium sp.]MBX9459210.1 M10 family metallopeptidase C-terminal domain-containing protein [Rhizobium sp.]